MPVCLCIFHSCFPAQQSIYNRDHMVCKAGKIYCLGFSEKICQPSLLKKIILFQEQTLHGWSFSLSFASPSFFSFLLFPPYLPSVLFFLLYFFLSPCCRRDMVCCYSTLNTSPNTWPAAAHICLLQAAHSEASGSLQSQAPQVRRASEFSLQPRPLISLCPYLKTWLWLHILSVPQTSQDLGFVCVFVFKINWEYFN